MAIIQQNMRKMLNFQSTTIPTILSVAKFERLNLLWQQMFETSEAIALTEDLLTQVESDEGPKEKFVAVICDRFCGLLWGKTIDSKENYLEPGGLQINRTVKFHPVCHLACHRLRDKPGMESLKFRVGLSFDPERIASFLFQLSQQLEGHGESLEKISEFKSKMKNIQCNDPTLQSEFTLQLIDILAGDRNPNLTTEQLENNSVNNGIESNKQVNNQLSICQPIQDAFQQQLERERLLYKVTSQIRQSLELPAILSTAVEQVRGLLEVDRLLIYQFEKLPDESETQEFCLQGRVTYEALVSDAVTSVIGLTDGEKCFVRVGNYREKYRKGFIQAIADVEETYNSIPCFLELMRRHHIRAKLIVPIVVSEKLWGLLIAQNCSYRQWEESEKIFLKQIGEHLAIAIYQAKLYAEIQQQKQTLEERVIERTRALSDALLAAESANRAKSEFVATMSHELRSPLTCAIGISATLLRWSFGNQGKKKIPIEKQRNYLQIIHDSSEHLLELINDILDLSQIEAGKTVLKYSEFSLSKLAYQTMHTFKQQATQKGVKLGIEQPIDPERDRFIADPMRLKQILFNLLSNAIKFTPAGGDVILRVWVEGNLAIFEVEDTGIGIPENQRSLLFQKFQQLDSPYSRQQNGTGLGLALTKQFVELHSGFIEVQSTVNAGSIFTVRIPAGIMPELKTKVRKKSNISSLRGSVVLIEDNEETATLICEILTAAGLKVVWIVEGSSAVEKIQLLQPIAVILSMNLLGMDGYEIIHNLRDTDRRKNMNIIALIGNEVPGESDRSLAAGANECVASPVDLEDLLDKFMA